MTHNLIFYIHNYILEYSFYSVISLYFSYLFWKQLLTKPVLRISKKKFLPILTKLIILFVNYFAHIKIFFLYKSKYLYLEALVSSFLTIFSMYLFIWVLKNYLRPIFNPFSKNEDLFSFLESIPVGIALSDHQGTFIYANKYLSQIFKYSNNEIVGNKVELFLPEKMHKEHVGLRDQFFVNPYDKQIGQGRYLEGQTKDKEQLYLEIALRPLSKKKNSKTILVIKDATQEYRGQRELKKKNELLDIATLGMPSHLAYIGKDGKYKFVNQALLNSWDVKREDIIEKHYEDFIPLPVLKEVSPLIEAALKGKDWNEKIQITFPKTGLKLIDTYFIPHLDNNKNVQGLVILGHDITELNDVVQKLESTNQQLHEFAFLLSHDLRAPVRHLANFIELFLEEIEDPENLSEKAKKYIKIIEKNSIKVQSMITGMLKIVSIRDLKPAIFELDICDFLNSLCHSFHNSKLEVDIQCDEKKSIHSDRDILEHVFTNLIQNSIKYTEDEKVRILISITHKLDEVIIDFKDNGPGLPEYLKTSLFQAFQKSQESDGLGLGLTIVKRSLITLGADINLIAPSEDPNYPGAHFQMKFPII